jgi:GDP-mannose 6-dehydrogenase
VQYVAEKHGVSLPMIGNLDSSNAEQINRAVEMALATGARRVGVLGLAFKPGTDDLRESPILEAMATLQAQGVELLAHDAAVTKDTPLEGLASYTKHGSQGLATLSAQLKDMLCDDIDQLMRSVDAVIVCHASDTYREAVTRHPDIDVIDVVRLFDTAPRNIAVNGIGW